MNKKTLFAALFTAALAITSFTSCDKSTPAVDEKTAPVAATGELKIAFVEVDSIMTQYEFCKDFSLILEKKSQNIQSTVNASGKKLQDAAQNFQEKLQQNAYTREQAQSIQAGLQKQNADLEALQARLAGEFQTETDKYNVALRDSLQHFLAKYNKDKKYSMILAKQGDNILYADGAYDITKEIVAGLNKAYKGIDKKASATEKK